MCALLASFTLGANMADVQAVYLLPMSGGLDQYLANRLTGPGVSRGHRPQAGGCDFHRPVGRRVRAKAGRPVPAAKLPDTDGRTRTMTNPQPHVSSFGMVEARSFWWI